jgi:hypothetical protein
MNRSGSVLAKAQGGGAILCRDNISPKDRLIQAANKVDAVYSSVYQQFAAIEPPNGDPRHDRLATFQRKIEFSE